MHEAEAIATFVLTAALALLTVVALVLLAVVAVVSVRVAGAIEAAARDGARAMHAAAQTAQSVARMTRRAERGVRRLGRGLARFTHLERLLGGRGASVVMAVLAGLESAGVAVEAFKAVRRDQAAKDEAHEAGTGSGEGGTAHVG